MEVLAYVSVLVSLRPSRLIAVMTSSSVNWSFTLISLFFLLVPMGGLTGCAPALSKQLREEAKPPILFQELLQSVERYQGRVAILGGYILETANDLDGSLLTILQAPLDSQNRPKSPDRTEGRFLVWTRKFLDPEIYSKDRKVTVGGKVAGSRQKALDNRIYEYPVIEAQEIYLWPRKDKYARPYYPYYYDPWCYPWYPYPYYRRHPHW